MLSVLIWNPTAHNVTAASRRVVEHALAGTLDLELASTEARGHAAEIAREAVEAGAKAIIAYGGDGTVNEIVNGLGDARGRVTLGILPGGGTNVLARTLGFPNDLVEATAHLIDLIERGSVRSLRLGTVRTDGGTERLFTFSAGVVFDAQIVRLVDETGMRPRWGDLAFVYNGFRAYRRLRRYEDAPIEIDTPDGPVDAFWAVACNSDPFTYFGRRPIRATPRADFERGLDLVAGTSAGFVRTLRWLTQTMTTARHVRDDRCLYLEDRDAIDIRARLPVPVQADGEFLGEATSIALRTPPDPLLVWA
jgi:diacylglycerol kinase family enzyme